MIAMRENSGKPWTPLDDERLRSLAIAGMDAKEIATELERTVSAVRSRAERKLRVSLKRVMVARRSPG
jgi:DNA-directed RNA polymerase specialized sigma24 family protein